jgi:hypothetical protein
MLAGKIALCKLATGTVRKIIIINALVNPIDGSV